MRFSTIAVALVLLLIFHGPILHMVAGIAGVLAVLIGAPILLWLLIKFGWPTN